MNWIKLERKEKPHDECIVATFGYTRIELYKPKPSKGYTLATYNSYRPDLNWSMMLRTKDLKKAKKKALKELVEYFENKKEDILMILCQLNDGLNEI